MTVAQADMGALAMVCGHATLGRIESSAAEMEQVCALLGDTMSVLRKNFSAALAADPDSAGRGECHRHLQAAMVALQSEDALAQRLRSMQRRLLQVADALRYALAGADHGPAPDPEHPHGLEHPHQLAARLRATVAMLESGITHQGPVAQDRAVAGTVDLF